MKTYSTYIGFTEPTDASAIHQFTSPDVYQQAHAGHDIDTFVEADENTVEVYIPWHAVEYAAFTVGEESSEPVEDANCNEEV